MKVLELIEEFGERGPCQCGTPECADAKWLSRPADITSGVYLDVNACRVRVKPGLKRAMFEEVVRRELPQLWDGKEHGFGDISRYLDCESMAAIQLIAMGHLLGVWTCMCPETMVPEVPHQMKIEMVSRGLITMQVKTKQEVMLN